MSSNSVMRGMRFIVTPLCFLTTAFGQTAQQPQPLSLQQKLQVMQQVAAKSQQQIRAYQWLESTTLTIDGKAKQPKQSICHYSADGQLIKSPVGEPASPQISGGPLKQHIIKKKIEEFQQEMAEVSSLTALYLPLNSHQFQSALHTRRVDFEHDQGSGTSVIVNDYAKPGDQLRITLNPNTLQIQKIVVQTYFDNQKDTLTAEVRLSELADGTV